MSQSILLIPGHEALVRALTVYGKPLHFHGAHPVVAASSALPRSRQAVGRLACQQWHATHGQNISLTCHHFGMSRPTFYRW